MRKRRTVDCLLSIEDLEFGMHTYCVGGRKARRLFVAPILMIPLAVL